MILCLTTSKAPKELWKVLYYLTKGLEELLIPEKMPK